MGMETNFRYSIRDTERGSQEDRDQTHRKDERDATSDGFGAIKVSLGAEKEVFFAVGRLPRHDGSTIEENLDRLAGW